ncbi:MAG: hypothetical protein KDI34_03270 [Halioglobus sp.]|jgi:IS5 family transposase|nr:hypothetical protein [Halioglobus sp.]
MPKTHAVPARVLDNFGRERPLLQRHDAYNTGIARERLTALDHWRTPATFELTVDREGLDRVVTALRRQVDRIRDELADSSH